MRLKLLGPQLDVDRQAIINLCFEMADYTLSHSGSLPTREDAEGLISNLPGLCSPENYMLFSVNEKHEIIGLMRVFRAWPTSEVAVIGLIYIISKYRRMNLGGLAVQHLRRLARSWSGITTFKLSVLDSNDTALHFWRSCGFKEISRGDRIPGFAGLMVDFEKRI